MTVEQLPEPDNALCECGHLFAGHKKPPIGTPWDICSFPCLRCRCTEFREGEAYSTMNSVYVLIAVDDDLKVRECVVVTSLPLANDLEKVLIKIWSASRVCMASRAVDEVSQNLIEAMLPPEPPPLKPPSGGWIGGGRHG